MSETINVFRVEGAPLMGTERIPVSYFWTLAHPMSGYYFGEESWA